MGILMAAHYAIKTISIAIGVTKMLLVNCKTNCFVKEHFALYFLSLNNQPLVSLLYILELNQYRAHR